MKKMFTLMMGLFLFSAVFAQRNETYNDRHNDNNSATLYDGGRYGNYDPNGRPDRAVEIQCGGGQWKAYGQMNDNDRRAEIDRIGRDYDRRIDSYRNDRHLNRRERDRAIDHLRKERADKLKMLGAGVLIGGVLGVLIGTNL